MLMKVRKMSVRLRRTAHLPHFLIKLMRRHSDQREESQWVFYKMGAYLVSLMISAKKLIGSYKAHTTR